MILGVGQLLRLHFIFIVSICISALVIPQRYKKIHARIRSQKVKSVKPALVRTNGKELNKFKTLTANLDDIQMKGRKSKYPKKHKKNVFLTSFTIPINQKGTKTEKIYVYMSAANKIYSKQKQKRPKSLILSFWG